MSDAATKGVGPTTEQDTWLRSALGLDPANYVDKARSSASAAQDAGSVLKTVKDAVVAGENTVVAGALAVEIAQYESAMKSLDAEIQNVAAAGLDPSHYAAQAKSIRDAYADAARIDGDSARVVAIGALMLRASEAAAEAKVDVARVAKSAVEGIGSAVTDMRDGAKNLIDKLSKDNKAKPELAKRLTELDASIAEVGKVTDRQVRSKRLKQVSVAAESLLDDAAGASKDEDAVQAVYAKTLKDRYGFEITNPSKMKNTHLDQVYKMFDKVPDTDVVQGKLKTLTYQPLNDKGGKNKGAAFGDAEIEMGDYGSENWSYKDPKTGKPTPANGFSISTLHELGHSVDDRYKIMEANQAKSGAGGWRQETIDSVAQAFVGEFKSGPCKSLKIEDKRLAAMVKAALSGADTKRPDKMPDADWAVLKPLLDVCASRRNDKWPWGSPHDIGGRCYHESYADDWWSYETAVRAKALTVRDYQWRAPGEFFAELYAYSYFNSQLPPNGIEAAIAAFMYGGKTASAAAP